MPLYYNKYGYIINPVIPTPAAAPQPSYSTSTLPTSASGGQTVYNTDAGAMQYYTSSGQWTSVSVPALSAAAIAALVGPVVGQTVFNTDTKQLQTYVGAALGGWKNACASSYTTAQLTSLTNVQPGQIAYNATSGKPQYYSSGSWRDFSTGGGGGDPVVVVTSTDYICGADETVIVCSGASTDISITLPLCSTRDGKPLLVIDASSHAVNLLVSGSDHIRTRTATNQTLQVQDDRVNIVPIAAVGMWYLI